VGTGYSAFPAQLRITTRILLYCSKSGYPVTLQVPTIIVPFRSCRKSTTAAAPLVAGSDEEEEDDAPHIVLKMHLHCASCAAKIERVVMDIPGTFARGLSLSAPENC